MPTFPAYIAEYIAGYPASGIVGGGDAVRSSMTINFINGTYERNGIFYPDFASFLTGTGSTFTRASTGFGTTSTGTLTGFAINAPRITNVGLLLEPTATNIMLQSQAFDDAAWTKIVGLTVTPNTFVAPDGTTTGNSTISTGFFQQITQFPPGLTGTGGQVFNVSIWAKQITGGGNLIIQLVAAPPTYTLTSTIARFNLTDTSNGGNPIQFYNEGAPSTHGAWGAQAERAAASGYFATNPSSYIPTTTAAATRAADVLTLNLPAGTASVTVTFDDASTQVFNGLSGGNWVVPVASLNRPTIRSFFLTNNSGIIDLATANSQFYATTWQSLPGQQFGVPPSNSIVWFNNMFGVGTLVNGVNFTSTLYTMRSNFPTQSLMVWTFDGTAGYTPGFAYGYPAWQRGGSPFSDADGPFNMPGPWPQKVADCTRLTFDYWFEIGDPNQTWNFLHDMYTTGLPNSSSGVSTGELSYFLYCNPNLPLPTPVTHTGVEVWNSATSGEYKIGRASNGQMCFFPTSAGGTVHRTALRATIDILEMFRKCVSKGWISDQDYIRGIELGPEQQTPANYNGAPPSNGWIRMMQMPVWTWT